ncbi:leucyl aminopeptidase family protein [Thermaurantiacus tibetensis]|uniref:leucyl aminopeptidase family protein n=1 Tax=Thermaurantiacus tibetensis TaxID=2759035 RepID=UPI001890101C|nr:leucyl aminopeptidase [Thermaurantiacus tibetensis]
MTPAARLLVAALLAAAPPLAVPPAAATGTLVPPSTIPNSAPRPIRFATAPASGGTLALVVAGDLASATSGLPAALAAAVRDGAAAAGFEAKPDQTLVLVNAAGHARIRVYGAEPKLAAARLQDLGGRIGQDTREDRGPVSVLAAGVAGDGADVTAELATGFGLGAYRFDRYRTEGRRALPTEPATFVSAEPAASEARFRAEGAHLVEAVTFARDLVTEPANVLYPESFVERVRDAFRGVRGVSIEVLDEAAMQRLGMGGILSVGQGSRRPPRLLVVRYRGAGDAAPVALVGKGITFDSGGISIKPAAGMWRMKYDMSGAARVMAATLAAARRGAPVNVTAVAALAENMPDGNATRPGDVVRTLGGKTIEIINTDAEGRVVLADANQYAARDRPAAIVNMATLTGAAAAALGDQYAALFARDEPLGRRIEAAAAASGDAVWRLPLHPAYARLVRSDIADVRNSTEGAGPGASLGAHFIEAFTPAAIPWAHLDIAGVAWRLAPTQGVDPQGASAWGVRLLHELLKGYERR